MAEKIQPFAWKVEPEALTFAKGEDEAIRFTFGEDIVDFGDPEKADPAKAMLWAIMLDLRQLVNVQMQTTEALATLVAALRPVTAPADQGDQMKDAMKTVFGMMAKAAPGMFPAEVLEEFGVDGVPTAKPASDTSITTTVGGNGEESAH